MQNIPAEKKKTGFTLIELLVVIAIIAILAAILFPVFARARENARRASCQSNEKNIALGFKQYIQDNGEKYPPKMDTAYKLKNDLGIQEYIKSKDIFYCPSDSDKINGSYGYKLDAENESAIDNTTTTVLLNETGTRHFAGMNAAYVDGHVKWSKGQVGAETTIGSGPVADFGSMPTGSRHSIPWAVTFPGNYFGSADGYPYAGQCSTTARCSAVAADFTGVSLELQGNNGSAVCEGSYTFTFGSGSGDLNCGAFAYIPVASGFPLGDFERVLSIKNSGGTEVFRKTFYFTGT